MFLKVCAEWNVFEKKNSFDKERVCLGRTCGQCKQIIIIITIINFFTPAGSSVSQ